METVITTESAQVYMYLPLRKIFAKNGSVFKAKGATVTGKRVGLYFQIYHGSKPTTEYLSNEHVAQAASAA